MNTSKIQTLSYCFALLFFVITPAISAEMKPWDSKAALELSDELYFAARRLNIECRQSPPKYLGEGTSGHFAFRYHVRHFMSVTNDLSETLSQDASKEETQANYDEAVKIMGELRKYAGGKNPVAWTLVVNAVTKAEGTLTQLGAYYSKE